MTACLAGSGLGVFLMSPAAGVEIPLKAGGSQNTRVGFIDMERIYREYPETRKAREEYRRQVAAHKTELAERERDLEALKREIDALREVPAPVQTSTGTVVPSTGPAGAVTERAAQAAAEIAQEGIRKRQEDLAKREADYERARAEAARALKEFEQEQATRILGRLYKALVQVAEEQGIFIVVDKSAILYGRDTIDLTETLSRRVRGLPDAADPGRSGGAGERP